MKLYLATNLAFKNGHELQQRIHEQKFTFRLLLSYFYLKRKNVSDIFSSHFVQPYPDLFLDSGAFSAMTHKTSISLREYALYIIQQREYCSLYANLDVIQNARKTWENQKKLEEEYGLAPLPVFHFGEDWVYLERYIDQYPYIALGIAKMPARRYIPWLIRCFKMAQERSVFHGFGITAWEVLKAFPWYSVDSTAWHEGKKWYHASLFYEKEGKFEEFYFGDASSCYRHAAVLRSMGLEPSDFFPRSAVRPEKIDQLGAISYLRAARWLTRRHGNVILPKRGKNVHHL